MKRLENYKLFVENMKQAKSIVAKKMDAYEKLKDLLQKNLGYIGKFTSYLMEENIPYEELVKTYDKIRDLHNKNYKLNINDYNFEELTDKIIDIESKLSINKMISRFPFNQKKFAKEILANNSSLLLSVSKSDKLDNLVRKISSYKTKDELLAAFKLFDKIAIRDKEDVIEYCRKNRKYVDIIYDDKNYLIVHLKGRSGSAIIKELGSESSWCIKDESWFRKYTKNGKQQFILFNYNVDKFLNIFKIAFTMDQHLVDESMDLSDRIFNINPILNEINFEEFRPKQEIETISSIDLKSTTSGTKLKSIIKNTSNSNLLNLIIKVFTVYPSFKTSTLKLAVGNLIRKYLDTNVVLSTDVYNEIINSVPKNRIKLVEDNLKKIVFNGSNINEIFSRLKLNNNLLKFITENKLKINKDNNRTLLSTFNYRFFDKELLNKYYDVYLEHGNERNLHLENYLGRKLDPKSLKELSLQGFSPDFNIDALIENNIKYSASELLKLFENILRNLKMKMTMTRIDKKYSVLFNGNNDMKKIKIYPYNIRHLNVLFELNVIDDIEIECYSNDLRSYVNDILLNKSNEVVFNRANNKYVLNPEFGQLLLKIKDSKITVNRVYKSDNSKIIFKTIKNN